MYMTQALHRLARSRPGAAALTDPAGTLDWRAAQQRIAQFAGALRASGLQPGDRVGMLAKNGIDFFTYIFGTFWAGGVINPVNVRWNAREIGFSLQDCGTRILFVGPEFAAMVPAIREQAPALERVVLLDGPLPDGALPDGPLPDEAQSMADWMATGVPCEDALRRGVDLAAILYTGGTTGKPKGVMLSHGNLAASMFGAMAMQRGQPPAQRYLHTAPLFHIGALSGLFMALYAECSHVFLPAFDPLEVLRMIQQERVSELFLVPTMLRMVIDHPRFGEFDTGSVQHIRYGASPMDGGLMDRAIAAFPGATFSQAYGMTELAPIATVLTAEDHGPAARASGRLRSAGRAIATAEVRIVDPQDRDLPPGAIGEIAVRGPQVMMGYWNRPDATAQALRGGWMHTGDMGRMDADGYVTVVDRLKDMIITGGENVYSAEVETALSTHPDVAQCAVIAVPDDTWGERVHAFVIARPGTAPDPASLSDHCRAQIAGFKIPRSFDFVAELPLSGAGKVLKNELRARFAP